MRKNTQKVIRILFYMYISVLFVLVIIKFRGSFYQLEITRNRILWNREQGFWNYNIKPFRTISPYLKNITDSYAYMNILGNIVPFIPFGFFVPMVLFKKVRFLKTILLSFLCVLLFEIFQFISMLGFFDIDDVILNTLGCMVGYLIYFLCMSFKHSQ
ncbi:MAG: VanZ family protein [Clostridiales bacterium]|nr:VanZ family protein [Clostridiales bacterium]